MGKLSTALYIAGGAVVVGGLVLYSVAQASAEAAARARAETQRLEDSVVMKARFSDECPRDARVLVSTANKSSRTVKNAKFKIGVYAEGRSANLNDDLLSPLEWDRVVAPGETIEACYSVNPNLPRDRYYLKVTRDELWPVEFYKDGEFIPRAASSNAGAR